jgi:hypothetical protein
MRYLFLAIFLTGLWAFKTQKDLQGDRISVLSVCDVAKNPDIYVGKQIRLRGILVGYHELALFDKSCRDERNNIRVDLDASGRTQLLTFVAEYENHGLREGNFWLEATLLGRLERIEDSGRSADTQSAPSKPHFNRYTLRLVISRIENVRPAEPDL